MKKQNNMLKIIPSIASANQLCIAEEIARLKDWPELHYDIEDGNFVPNITFGTKLLRGIAEGFGKKLDIHLLVNHPEDYLDCISNCHASAVCFHIEAAAYPLMLLNDIRNRSMRSGIALNFITPAEVIIPFIPSLDYVLVMTAEPDGNGERFHPPIMEKVRRVRSILPPEKGVWVDGGVSEKMLPLVLEAGADTVIMGRCIFSADDAREKLWELTGR